MCGIIAYIGHRDALPIIQRGLRKLNYRGYDSWGIGLKTNKKIEIYKGVGDFEEIEKLPKLGGNFGIGHVRWSTHGRVSYENSHPHTTEDGSIAVVHNGIIENFNELKKELLKRGHKFKSETDTEVVCHLIEEFSKNCSFPEAVRKAFLKLEGRNALVAMSRDFNGLVGVKKGSPMMVGLKSYDGEYFIASDTRAFAGETDKVIFLDDNEMVVLN